MVSELTEGTESQPTGNQAAKMERPCRCGVETHGVNGIAANGEPSGKDGTALPLVVSEPSEGTESQPTEIHNGKERNALALVALDRCCSNQRNGLAVAVSELTKGKRSATKQ